MVMKSDGTTLPETPARAPAEPPACPLVHRPDFTPCDPRELDPLVDWLQSGRPVTEPRVFPRGTLLPDGRLDLCKQSLGPANAERILEALGDFSHVSSLLMGTNGLGNSGARAVARLIEQNPHVRTVYLGCNLIEAEGTRALADAVRGSRTVEGLWLKRNPLGPDASGLLAGMLEEASSLRTLDLVNTGLGAEGLRALLEALPEKGAGIEWLYLGGNGLDATTGPALARLLRRHPRLQGLFLSANPLRDEGVEQLARGLAENGTLRALGLCSIGLTARGVSPLVEALKRHPALEQLDFSHAPSTKVLGAPTNHLGDEGAQALADLVRTSRSLRRLDVRQCGLTREGARCLVEAAQGSAVWLELQAEGGLPDDVRALWLEHRRHVGTADNPLAAKNIRSVYR